jgi:carbon monoxide dehydrogenase subunit G
MKFENEFDVQAPIDEVYEALLDVERVAPCMPGAEVIETTGDDAYKVAIKVKVGPMSMTYKGDVQIVERDDAAKTATLRAKAKEARGQGTADAHVRMALAEAGGGTHAALETEVQLSGRVAAMGRGVIADVSGRLVETFARNLAEMLEGGPAEPAAAASSNGAAAPAPEPATVTASAGAPTAAAGEPAAAPATPAAEAPTAPRPKPRPAEPAESSLPVGEIVAGVVAGRLQDPKTLFASAGIFGMLCLVLGYLLGRAR